MVAMWPRTYAFERLDHDANFFAPMCQLALDGSSSIPRCESFKSKRDCPSPQCLWITGSCEVNCASYGPHVCPWPCGTSSDGLSCEPLCSFYELPKSYNLSGRCLTGGARTSYGGLLIPAIKRREPSCSLQCTCGYAGNATAASATCAAPLQALEATGCVNDCPYYLVSKTIVFNLDNAIDFDRIGALSVSPELVVGISISKSIFEVAVGYVVDPVPTEDEARESFSAAFSMPADDIIVRFYGELVLVKTTSFNASAII